MNGGTTQLILSLGLAMGAVAQAGEPEANSNGPMPGSAVRGRILELLKQDVMKATANAKGESAPPSDSAINDQPVAEGVLELEPIVVTEKKPFVLQPRLKLTLDNFFYGDGKIFESAGRRVSLSAGSEGKGLAAIKFNIRF